MKTIVAPIELSEQQREYILAGYAAFLSAETIYMEFSACFPAAIQAFAETDPEVWEDRLKLSIRQLDRSHPAFPAEYEVLFAGLRRKYLSEVGDTRLSAARARFLLMEETLAALETFKSQYPEKGLDCAKLNIEVIKTAQKESQLLAEMQSGKQGFSREEVQNLIAKLTPEQREVFKKRSEAGEHPDLIIAEMLRSVQTLPRTTAETDEKTQPLDTPKAARDA